jgi:hypothetical protein
MQYLAGVLLVIAALPATPQTGAPQDVPVRQDEADAHSWSFSTSLAGYIIPDSPGYVSPTATADRGGLHLEGRYNYEDMHTGSLWVGYNFALNDKTELTLTPMLGGVFGKTTGVAPGYTASFRYKALDFFSQGELLVDTGRNYRSYFYTWSELGFSLTKWLRAGAVTQRTRAYRTDLDIQRGFFAGVTHGRLEFTTYVFNLGWTDPTINFSLAAHF